MLIAQEALEERRRATAVGGPLAPLYESLSAELEPWLERPLYVPEAKALLSRAGGRCATDGSTLEFDPASPHEHRCPRCHRRYAEEAHHRAWVMSYHLWLAERALHAALFFLLRGNARHARFAASVLGEYAARYSTYPNIDNVLGPSRLFFSTYLESVWLLQICLATRFLAMAGDDAVLPAVRSRIADPARAMIGEFDEGMSNRQVWNNAALIAAALLCDDQATVAARATGRSGVQAHLSTALLPDGSWYEGENYHQFALRGLWYGVTLLDNAGVTIPAELLRRFDRAFAIPALTALPDFTMPSRKDSQYAVSLRQWRMAELLELGAARQPDAVLLGALARCYEPGHERRDTGRARSTADIERNAPPGSLTRADLGWRALLHALPQLPTRSEREPRSTILPDQGYAVFRREDATYVGFEFGQSGGGHGHPDRLNITLSRSSKRLLDDLGTGSYVDASLHWYRSTLAHNAPLVAGRSQPLRDGMLVAYEERDGMGWIVARFDIPELHVRIERALVVMPDYLIDDVRWMAEHEVDVDLPWHLDVAAPANAIAATLTGSDAAEDGFRYLKNVKRMPGSAHQAVIRERSGDASLTLHATSPVTLFFASAPGQPAHDDRPLVVARARGRQGNVRTVIAWTESSVDASAQSITITARDGERHVHRRDDRGWHTELNAGGARSSIDLSGFVAAAPATVPEQRHVPHAPMRVHRSAGSFRWLSDQTDRPRHDLHYALGDAHYRRSETSWEASGRPSARLAITATDDTLVIHGEVHAGDRVFAPADARNPYDNEHPDTMAAGVQLHLREGGTSSAWMLVPERESERVRVRAVMSAGRPAPMATWRPAGAGWEFRIELPVSRESEVPLALDVIINETVAGRERRRGQLVLSGARGEFVYLRGDRQGDEHLIPLVIVP